MAEGSQRIVGRIYGNLVRLLGGKAGAALLSLGYLALATRALGPKDYGALVLVHAYVVTIGGLISFPGWHAVVRYGAQAATEGDRGRLGRLLAFVALVESIGGGVAILVAALLAPVVGPHLGWSPSTIALAIPYSVTILASVRSTPAGYLQLRGRFDLLGVHSLVAPLLRLVGAAVAFLLHAGLHGFLVAWLIAGLGEWLSMWAFGAWAARGQLSPGHFSGGSRAAHENPRLWRFMLAANADVTLAELSGRVSPLAVGWILGPAAAGLFAVAQRGTVVLAQPAQILGQAAYAEFARLAAGRESRAIRGALLRAVGVALAVAAPVCALVAIFGRDLAAVMGGKAFADAGQVMVWLAVARAVLLAGPPLSAALTALGRPGLSVTANLVSALGPLLVLPPLLMALGLTGAGVHALLQAALGIGLLGLFTARQTTFAPAAA